MLLNQTTRQLSVTLIESSISAEFPKFSSHCRRRTVGPQFTVKRVITKTMSSSNTNYQATIANRSLSARYESKVSCIDTLKSKNKTLFKVSYLFTFSLIRPYRIRSWLISECKNGRAKNKGGVEAPRRAYPWAKGFDRRAKGRPK